jgi:[ribosomal protein S5]-alanine N-acetyltransferase
MKMSETKEYAPSSLNMETERFVLRILTVDDATQHYLSWLHDPDIAVMLASDGLNATMDGLREFIAWHNNVTRFLFGIFTKDGKFIGTHSIQFFPEEDWAAVGVMIGDREYWGEAVPLETRARLLEWVFENLGCGKVRASCFSINRPSIFNFKRQGWQVEKVAKEAKVVHGKPADLIYFTITAEQFAAVASS